MEIEMGNRFIIKSFLLGTARAVHILVSKSTFDVGFHAVSASKSYNLRAWATKWATHKTE